MAKVPTGGGKFLKGVDIQEGDTAIIKTEADWITGEYKGKETNQYCCTIDYKDEERTLKFTKISRINCLAFGSDSKEWVGKKVSLKAVDIMVDAKMYKTIIVEPFGTKEPTDADKDEAQKAWDDA